VSPLRIIPQAEVTRLLPMRECIALMENALSSLARGEVVLPLRPVLRIPETPNVFAMMPTYSAVLPAFGVKLITVFPGNHGTDLDSHQGAVALFDVKRGQLVALLDASSITAIRTAAVSAVATKLLAREDAATLAILGSGVQARTHLVAIRDVRPIKIVRVWSRNAEHARQFAAWAKGEHDVTVEVTASAELAVRNADIICTTTAAREPVLKGAWLADGAHVNAVGASVATAREIDSDAIVRSRLFTDRRESALNEAGDVIIPMREGRITADHIVAELGEILIGAAPGRGSRDEITVFKSLGIAIEDLVSACHVHARAEREKVGVVVELGGTRDSGTRDSGIGTRDSGLGDRGSGIEKKKQG
jgi:alanine dehydrogenase